MTSKSRGVFDLTGRSPSSPARAAAWAASSRRALARAGADLVITAATPRAAPARAPRSRRWAGAPCRSRSTCATRTASRRSPRRRSPRFRRIDILVNNAGCNVRKPAVEVTWDDWNLVLDTNLRGPFFVRQAVARRSMIPHRYGRIINIGSVTSVFGYAGLGPYCASRGGVKQLTMSLADDWGVHGITVNCLAPGLVQDRAEHGAVRGPGVGRVPDRPHPAEAPGPAGRPRRRGRVPRVRAPALRHRPDPAGRRRHLDGRRCARCRGARARRMLPMQRYHASVWPLARRCSGLVARRLAGAQTPARLRAPAGVTRLPGPVRDAAGRSQVPGLAQGLRALRGRGADGLLRRRRLRLRRLLPLRRGQRGARGSRARRGRASSSSATRSPTTGRSPSTAASSPGSPTSTAASAGRRRRRCCCASAPTSSASSPKARRDPGRDERRRGQRGPRHAPGRSRTTSRAWPSCAKLHGVRVVLASLLPVSDDKQDARRPAADAHAAIARRRRSRELNRWLSAYAAQNGHVYLDYFSATADANGLLPARAQRRRPAPERPGLRA